MRSRKKTRILAIDPGTREMGIAVLENGSLLYQGVETLQKFTSAEDCLDTGRTAVGRLIRDFRPSLLVVEKTFIGRNPNTILLNDFARQVCATGRDHGIAVMSLAPNTVKKAVAGHGNASKSEVARAVAATFPALKAYLPPERKWKRKRQFNMFDAVALGLACLSGDQIRQRNAPRRSTPTRKQPV
jgi:Holliday junction resolvasome RuvABC endonuclease subunit